MAFGLDRHPHLPARVARAYVSRCSADSAQELAEKASRGEIRFGPEPDNRDQLPEEANVEQVENQELENQLLNDEKMDEKNEKKVNLVGDRMARVLSFLDPWHDPQGTSYHLVQSLLAFGSGGLTGSGLGASKQKFGWLPEQSTDAIFSVWGQEVGFLGAALLILLFLVIAWRGYRVARMAPDGFSQLLATGCTTWIVFQSMLNIGAVSGSLPFTGVPLPFISYGGSSLVISLAAVGLLLNISKHANAPATEPSPSGTRNARILRLEPNGSPSLQR